MTDADTGTGGPDGTGDPDKRTLRSRLLAERSRLPAEETRRLSAALARQALRLPELSGSRTVAAYVSVGGEPGTRVLLDALRMRGVRVLLPVLLPDNDLDWAVYEGADRLVRVSRPGKISLLEPDGPVLGPQAVTEADTVLLPGLAVDGRGRRLGRGGGSYDRVLARLDAVGARPALVVLLYDEEVLDRVPARAHDRPVRAAVTPSGVRRFDAADDGG